MSGFFVLVASSRSNDLHTISERTEPVESITSSHKVDLLPSSLEKEHTSFMSASTTTAKTPKLGIQVMPSISIRSPLTKQQMPSIVIGTDESTPRERKKARNTSFQAVKHAGSPSPERSLSPEGLVASASPKKSSKEAVVRSGVAHQIGKTKLYYYWYSVKIN